MIVDTWHLTQSQENVNHNVYTLPLVMQTQNTRIQWEHRRLRTRQKNCQLRLGGHLSSRLLTSHNNNIPTHQQPVGVGQHCQLRLGGHLTLTNITQQQHTNSR